MYIYIKYLHYSRRFITRNVKNIKTIVHQHICECFMISIPGNTKYMTPSPLQKKILMSILNYIH